MPGGFGETFFKRHSFLPACDAFKPVFLPDGDDFFKRFAPTDRTGLPRRPADVFSLKRDRPGRNLYPTSEVSDTHGDRHEPNRGLVDKNGTFPPRQVDPRLPAITLKMLKTNGKTCTVLMDR